MYRFSGQRAPTTSTKTLKTKCSSTDANRNSKNLSIDSKKHPNRCVLTASALEIQILRNSADGPTRQILWTTDRTISCNNKYEKYVHTQRL